MLSLKNVTNPNPLIEEKVNYFHNCFHYWLLDAAMKLDGFPENHLTYLERMAFRGQTLHRMHQSTRKPLESWLNKPEFDIENDEFAKKDINRGLISELKSIVVKEGKKFDLTLFNATVLELIRSMNGSDGLNGSVYFHEVLKSAISCLRCPCALEKHKIEISNYAKWIVAEFIRQGFDIESPEGLQGVFERILSLEELKKSKRPHAVPFPLPLELEQKRNKPGFKKALNEYISPDPFLSQFEGFLHSLQKTHDGDVFMRIENINIVSKTDPFKFEYSGVTFVTYNQIDVDKSLWSESMVNDFEETLGMSGGVVAIVPLKFKTATQAITQARFLINRALDALRYFANKKGAVLAKDKSYVVFKNGHAKFNYSSSNSIITISGYDINLLQNSNNSIQIPDIKNPEIKRYLERCDRIFFKCLSCEDPDDMISHFWQYWEASFTIEGFSGDRKGEQIINCLSMILSSSSIKPMRVKLGMIIYNYVINNIGELGVPEVFQNKNFDWENPESMVEYLSAYINYPFLRELIDRFKNINQAEEEVKWKSFYTDFLWQLYEQRNMISHEGKYCAATLDRLKFFFKEIGSRWRAKLFNELERNTDNSIEAVIKQLVAEAEVIPS